MSARAKSSKNNGRARSSSRPKWTGETADGKKWSLRLYVAGQTPRSTAALANLKKICEEYLTGRYHIEVVDLMKSPELARAHQILAIPTLVRELPEPLRRIIGDLSNTERALVGLDVKETR